MKLFNSILSVICSIVMVINIIGLLTSTNESDAVKFLAIITGSAFGVISITIEKFH